MSYWSVKTAQLAFRTYGLCDPHTIITLQTKALHQFVAGAEQSDDLTMLAIRYNKVNGN